MYRDTGGSGPSGWTVTSNVGLGDIAQQIVPQDESGNVRRIEDLNGL